MNLLPPTSQLAPIKLISSQDVDALIASVHYLRMVYNPEVRGSRRRTSIRTPVISTGSTDTAQAEIVERELALKQLRTDAFERAYAVKWLTGLISHFGSVGGNTDHNLDIDVPLDSVKWEKVIQDAASLLAVCAGTASAGTVTREFTFAYNPHSLYLLKESGGNCRGVVPITVTLTDVPLDNQDYGSVGAQTWGGACVLSEMIVENPRRFGLDIDQLSGGFDDNSGGGSEVFRVLELGSGTGLVSLVVGKLLREVVVRSKGVDGIHHQRRRVEIVATDYYPSVMENLQANVQANAIGSGGAHSSVIVVQHLVHSLDWSRFGVEDTRRPPFDRPFDLVLGADIVYEAEHAAWIRSCLVRLLRKPSARSLGDGIMPDPVFHLVIPLRATHRFESGTIETIFCAGDDDTARSPSLRVQSRETIVCDAETGEEVEYAYYKIGWGCQR